MWSTINALQVFDEIFVTTRGGPLRATTVVVYYLYQQAFEFFHGRLRRGDRLRAVRGDLVVSLVQLWFGNRRVHYSS